MTTKPKLTLLGDAWIYGTWKSEQKNLIPDQPGMSQWLSDRFDVVVDFYDANHGIWNDVARVKSADLSGTVIVFQSNTAHRLHSNNYEVSYSELARQSKDLAEFFSSVVDGYYQQLDKIAADANTKIYLCGSVTDIDESVIAKYPNLVNLCTSWINLCCSEHTPSPVMQGYVRQQQFDLDLEFERIDRNDLLEQLSMTNNPFKSAKLISSELFQYVNIESKLWPTLEAHRIIAEHILKHLPQ